MTDLGVIAAGSAQSVEAGAEVFRGGGNAVDAAVGAAFAVAAGDPSITSLAGGGVLIFRDGATGEVEVCDFFVDAPGLGGRRVAGGDVQPPPDFEAVDLDFGVGETLQRFYIGRGSAAVPGVIPGLAAVLERWGSLSLEDVVAPTVTLLREGVRLTEYQVDCIRVLETILRYSAVGRRLFLDAAGQVVAPGAIFRNSELASTLERLGRDGLESVYGKDIAEQMLAEFSEEHGGRLTAEDLQSWKAEFRPALLTRYGGATVALNPAPSIGGRFIQRTLELFESAGVGDVPQDSPERYRRTAAVFRAVSEVRVEDPGIVDRPAAAAILDDRLQSILGDGGRVEAGTEPGGPGNTTHISVIDRSGNAAAVTISHGEGCGYWVGDSGLHMNNILGEADLFPEGFHRFTPGERLQTMMAPTIIVEPSGGVTALGSGGSNRIRTAIAQVISALLDDRLEAGEAVKHGRIHVESGVLSGETYALPGDDTALEQARQLVRETKVFGTPSLFFGGVHLVRRGADGKFSGAGDPRRGGVVRIVEA